MITEDYVSFETAKLLKEKGFDEGCFKYAINDEIYNKGDYIICSAEDVIVGIPTTQMAMKWLREVHNLHITIIPYNASNGIVYHYEIYKIGQVTASLLKETSGFETVENTCKEAINYCLMNLI